MRFSNILLSVALAFNTVKSHVIDINDSTNADLMDRIQAHGLNIPSSGKYVVDTVENNNFKYDIHCLEDYNDMCNVLKEELNYALDILSSTFEFYQPVSFDAYVDDLQKYGMDSAIAVTTDVNYITLRESNDNTTAPYIYPQSLAKQLNLNTTPNYLKDDFIIILNTFKSHPNYIKNGIKFSISEVILHELIHGLGFIGNGILEQVKVGTKKTKYNFTPSPISSFGVEDIEKATTKDELRKLELESEYTGYSPLSVFEKNLVDVNTKKKIFEELGFLYRDINCFDNGKIKFTDLTDQKTMECINKLDPKTHELIYSIASDYYMKKDSLGILTNSNTIIKMKTFDNKYMPGSSVFHTENTKGDAMEELMKDEGAYKQRVNGTLFNSENLGDYMDENFLMNYSADNIDKDVYLESIAKNNKHGLIGQGIVEVLETLGWTEKGEQRNNSVYYVDNEIIIPEQTIFKYLFKIYEILIKEKGGSTTSDAKSISNMISITTFLFAFIVYLLF